MKAALALLGCVPLSACPGNPLRPLPTDEVCNGRDDDADGLVDEGSADTDGDGLADCIDGDCEPVAVPIVASDCAGRGTPAHARMWELEAEWVWQPEWEGSPVHPAAPVLVQPAAGGSGVWLSARGQTDPSPWGTPDVRALDLVVDYPGAAVPRLLVDWEPIFMFARVGVILGTLALHSGASRTIGAHSLEGAEVWSATAPTVFNPNLATVMARSDGVLLVPFQQWAFDVITGELAAECDLPDSRGRGTTFDADLDGAPELYWGGTAWDEEFRMLGAHGGDPSTQYAAAQLDADPEGELIVRRPGALATYEHDGSLRSELALPADGEPGPLCTADMDGDGETEIGGVVEREDLPSLLELRETDGELVWSVPLSPGFGDYVSACSAFDFEGDGAYELLVQTASELLVLDGRTGEALIDWPTQSWGGVRLPTLSDVDGDGSVEILLAAQGDDSTRGIWVLGHPLDLWMPGERRDWPSFDFDGSNYLADGTIANPPEPSWLAWNMLRGMPPGHKPRSNLVPELTACASGCGAANGARVTVSVRNSGDLGASGDVLVEVRGGGDTVLDSRTLQLNLLPGEGSPPYTVELPGSALAAGGLRVRVDAAPTLGGAVVECHEADNEAPALVGVCGG